jgi:hypothetical protein
LTLQLDDTECSAAPSDVVSHDIMSELKLQLARVGSLDDLLTVMFQFGDSLDYVELPLVPLISTKQAMNDAARDKHCISGTRATSFASPTGFCIGEDDTQQRDHDKAFPSYAKGLLQQLRQELCQVCGVDEQLRHYLAVDIVRAASRTTSGGDAYTVLSGICSVPGTVLTPASAQAKPIQIDFKAQLGRVVIRSFDEFELHHMDRIADLGGLGDSEDGGKCAPLLRFRTEIMTSMDLVPSNTTSNKSEADREGSIAAAFSPRFSSRNHERSASGDSARPTSPHMQYRPHFEQVQRRLHFSCHELDPVQTSRSVLVRGAGSLHTNGMYELRYFCHSAPLYELVGAPTRSPKNVGRRGSSDSSRRGNRGEGSRPTAGSRPRSNCSSDTQLTSPVPRQRHRKQPRLIQHGVLNSTGGEDEKKGAEGPKGVGAGAAGVRRGGAIDGDTRQATDGTSAGAIRRIQIKRQVVGADDDESEDAEHGIGKGKGGGSKRSSIHKCRFEWVIVEVTTQQGGRTGRGWGRGADMSRGKGREEEVLLYRNEHQHYHHGSSTVPPEDGWVLAMGGEGEAPSPCVYIIDSTPRLKGRKQLQESLDYSFQRLHEEPRGAQQGQGHDRRRTTGTAGGSDAQQAGGVVPHYLHEGWGLVSAQTLDEANEGTCKGTAEEKISAGQSTGSDKGKEFGQGMEPVGGYEGNGAAGARRGE